MLYIFHVDTGTMMTFDMNYALESVVSLKLRIEHECKIPVNKQVLLVSGGEVLRHDAKVCYYSAGTDTNPIYMFSKTIIESNEPPKSNMDYGFEIDFKDQVEKCLNMAPSYSTVVSYTQTAQALWDQARENIHSCEKLVHDQHLQQQGWAAVVANMEDVTKDFQERAENFEKKFRDQLNKKNEYVEFLRRFNDDLEILASIPILPALRLNAVSHPFTAFDELHGDSECYDDNEALSEEGEVTSDHNTATSGESNRVSGSTNSEGDGEKENVDLLKKSQFRRMKSQNTKEALTLLHWINIKENQESLKHIAEYCQKAMELFDTNVMTNLRADINEALSSANQINMKHINGLEERLSGLEKLMCDARRVEQEQKDLANAFMKQQNAATIGDMSILRVLCESLAKQMQNMLRNHEKLRDIRRRCINAKAELAANLCHRLQWIVYVENRMFETDSKLMFYHRSLSRLKRHLVVIEQLHRAPRLFCTAVHEIVRRRTFSQAFLSWASELARHLLTIHNEEVKRRRVFHTLFSGHFLGDLFPGTNDIPPPYGTQAPKVFDADLPRLTQSDVETLTNCLPHLTPEIPPYDMSPIIHFFQIRPGLKPTGKQSTEEKTTTKEAGVDRGFESETDTEEFEKVGQSPIERGGGVMQLPAAPIRTDATTITEDNMECKRNEADHLKESISSICEISSQTISLLRNDLNKLKSEVCDHKVGVDDQCSKVIKAWEKYIQENSIREREVLQRLTVDHELEMNDIKQTLIGKDEKILVLEENILKNKKESVEIVDKWKLDMSELQQKIMQYENFISEQNKKLEEAEVSKQKALKDLQDKLTMENKAEVESLRSRFRLVTLTSMDRSPSESSLEKIERTDMIEIQNHNAILLQTQVDMEEKKEETVKLALKVCDEEWNARLNDELVKMRSKYEFEKQLYLKDAMKRIVEEKDRQLDQSRDRESVLLKECKKYKETIQQLIDPETSDIPYLQSKIDALQAEKIMLEEKVKNLGALNPSPLKLDVSTSTDHKIKRKMAKGHTPLGIVPRTLSVSSCNKDDIVLVLWDGAHCNYTILQESCSLYLLHNDSLGPLDLKLHIKDEVERRLYAIGKVESKEYCSVVKRANKYQVAIGQCFYRVKVRPLKSSENTLKKALYCCESTSKETDSSHNKSDQLLKSCLKDASMTESAFLTQSTMSTVLCDAPEVGTSGDHSKSPSAPSAIAESRKRCDSDKNESVEMETNITVQSVICVPYTSEVGASDANEQISEIAEEAAP